MLHKFYALFISRKQVRAVGNYQNNFGFLPTQSKINVLLLCIASKISFFRFGAPVAPSKSIEENQTQYGKRNKAPKYKSLTKYKHNSDREKNNQQSW